MRAIFTLSILKIRAVPLIEQAYGKLKWRRAVAEVLQTGHSVRRHIGRWNRMRIVRQKIRELRWYFLVTRFAAVRLQEFRHQQRRTFIHMMHLQRWAHRCARKVQASTRHLIWRRGVQRRWKRVWALRSEIVAFMGSEAQVRRWGVNELINTLNSPDLWPNPRLWWHRYILYRIKLITLYAGPGPLPRERAVGSIRRLYLSVSSTGVTDPQLSFKVHSTRVHPTRVH